MVREGPRGPGWWLREFSLRSARRTPPLWQAPLLALVFAGVTVALWNRRGVAVGIVAFLAYASMVASSVIRRRMGSTWWDRATAWSARHRVLDATLGPLFAGALAFCAFAFITSWALTTCLFAAAGITLGLMALGPVRAWQLRRIASN